jgi:hypothetical protein
MIFAFEIVQGMVVITQMAIDSTSHDGSQVLYLNIAASEKGLAELSGNRRIIFIPKDQIQGVEIKFGCQAEKPLVQGIIGSVLTVVGIIGIYVLAGAGFALMRWALGFVFFGGIGVWLIWEASRRGYYFRVIRSNGTRNLLLKGSVQKPELSNFVRQASQLGYNFRDQASN